ncbi:U-box domain-containing protein 52 isoform X2 [Ricinus communis]|uniref:U-box domain-containing protein 52 isoform X2 n=1 Tax=Ricinus communis TaxID=3988 RepID=UPI00077214E6|nr:U-box domain-containing protein 52 isoform X2 [Ricinus communis]|eukprot:XP_015571170.1 U-box domain-containing protein 52 isoform X1 [Ricinus communis]
MWLPKTNGSKKAGTGLVAVAIDKDKGSQNALKWALENLLSKGQTVVLVHVLHRVASYTGPGYTCDFNSTTKHQLDKMTKELFLSFRCYCTRKDVQCLDIVLEDQDVVKGLVEYVSYAAIENLVIGASRHGFIRKFKADIPTSVSKGAPDFCNVYVISKGKISSMRQASRSAPYASPLIDQIQSQSSRPSDASSDTLSMHSGSMRECPVVKPRISLDESFKSPFERGGRAFNVKSFAEFMDSETDISFVSSGRPSTDRSSSVALDFIDSCLTSRLSTSSETSFGSIRSGPKFNDCSSLHEFSTFSHESGATSFSGSSQSMDDMEAEMRRLKLELKQTMDMYSTACKEALTAKQKAVELHRWRVEEERRMEEAKLAEEAALSAVQKEKARCRAAMEAAEAAKKIAELEAQKRLNVELRALKEAEEMKKVMDALAQQDLRYRRYSIEEIEQATEYFAESRMIGEGGYGPVYKCYLDHTPVAVKVLRPDAAQGRSQFQREVEVLSLIRHPNMVLLLGACPEYGVLVYEYMAKGSLDDCLFRRGNTPVLPWQLRFRIAAQIATGLLFLHQTKPEPLVHRDLKPGNILLDHNYVCKISDVGLARLVPAVAENVTQYHMTSTAGTFCYIDPEYQQTGMLGVKSDVYSLGIMLLQLITAKPPMGLTHMVEQAIEKGSFKEILDPAVGDWPMEEALTFAKLALQCAELRRKDRPDLGKEVLPELERLRSLAEEDMNHMLLGSSGGPSPHHSYVSRTTTQEVISDPLGGRPESLYSQSSISSSSLAETQAEAAHN